jgi:hypothetical protein
LFLGAVRIARAVLLTAGFLCGCAQTALPRASLSLNGTPAQPAALGEFLGAPPVRTVAQWERERAPALRDAFQRYIYGYFPDESRTEIVSRGVIEAEAFGDDAVIEELHLRVSATFDAEAADSDVFRMELILPREASGPVPILLIQTFCPSKYERVHPAVSGGGPGVHCGRSVTGRIMRLLFGSRIATAPIDRLVDEGYGAAILYSRQVVPDKPRAGLDALDAFAPTRAESDTRWGAIAAWAWLYSRMLDAIEKDPRIDTDGVVALGHSRYGKAALLAAAFDPRIDAVIANQSGLAGAALTRSKTGETIAQATRSYPHWFATAFDNFEGKEQTLPVDQHLLLALIAPRPILLGNARRDVWSDPNASFRAAQSADAVYELYGRQGLDQDGLKDFRPDADIAFWLRPGMHGVLGRDWDAFLKFLNAHFPRD